MEISQDMKCRTGLHKYTVYKQEDIKDVYVHVIGIAIINRCNNCGKLNVKYVYTVNGRP